MATEGSVVSAQWGRRRGWGEGREEGRKGRREEGEKRGRKRFTGLQRSSREGPEAWGSELPAIRGARQPHSHVLGLTLRKVKAVVLSFVRRQMPYRQGG